MLALVCFVLVIVAASAFPSGLAKSFNLLRLPAARQRWQLHMRSTESPFVAAMIVPTGVQAAVGGYAGDALPAARLLASVVDHLITHPNVINGAMLYWPTENLHYVEGSSLDAFAEGRLSLELVQKGGNSIGLLLDKGMDPEQQLRHIQVADAMRATLGINVAHCAVTSRAVGVDVRLSARSGASWGSVADTSTLVEGARVLVEQYGCTAIAVVVKFPEDSDRAEEGEGAAASQFQQYRSGCGVDAIAGAEALISHVIGKTLQVPCAHAPSFLPTAADSAVAPKACAEELGYTFLPCVLANLHRAPRLLRTGTPPSSGGTVLRAADVDVVVAPYNALGGAAVLAFLALGKTVIAVQDNDTVMQVGAADLLGVEAGVLAGTGTGTSRAGVGRVVRARSYAEAAGLVAALREGLLLDALTPSVPSLPVTLLS